jgi:predicted Zn-dependent protease
MRQVLSGVLVILGIAVLLLFTATPSHAGLKLGKLFRMSRGMEASIASQMHDDLVKDPGLITSGKDYDLVQEIGGQIVKKNQLNQYDYKFFLTKDKEVNAFATPGGYIYVTQGLLKYMAYDKAQMAGVIAHELGHAKDRHVAKGYEKILQGAVGLGVVGIALGKQNLDVTKALGQAGGVVLLKYNRDQEEWADRYGVEMSYKAGYDAYGLMRSLECLQALYGSTDSVTTWVSNHPATNDRIERTKRIAYEASGKHAGYMSIPRPPKDHPLYKLYGSSTKAAPETAQDGTKTGEIGTAEKFRKKDKHTSPVH